MGGESQGQRRKWGGKARRGWRRFTEPEGAGDPSSGCAPRQEEPEMGGSPLFIRRVALLAWPPSSATSAAPARGPQGRSWGWEGGPNAGAGGPGKSCLRTRGEGVVAAAQTKKSWARIDVCMHLVRCLCERGPRMAGSPVPSGRALTVRVLPFGALPVVHPAEPLEVVIVAAPRSVHRHHGEVRHRARPLLQLPAGLSPLPRAGAPRPLAFFPAALTSSARPPSRPSGAGSRRDSSRLLLEGAPE